MSSTSSSKNHSKKAVTSRERDKTKAVESGGSSQCDTPPLNDKDGTSSQGKFAGVSAESVYCMAEQIGAEINAEAASNLAEDVSYKLRQTISTIALHSEMMKKSRLEMWDVNSVFMLSDTSPVVGTTTSPYAAVGDEKIVCQYDNLVNITDIALNVQSYTYTAMPTVSVEWVTDESSLNNNSNISVYLQNYYTKVARAILSLKKKLKDLAVEDLATNTRIGPIFPNLFNLAVLVLNDDNLNTLNVPVKKPLQLNVLDMVDALCSNPCSLDTNIQQQFKRLFPVMVSNILGNGSLAEKMVAILTKITRTWPSFIAIGKSTLYDYLSQGSKERLTAPMIKCVMALGRRALVDCLEEHLQHLHAATQHHPDLRDVMLNVSTILLRSEPTTYLEDYVTTDYTLYEILGDSIMPRRTIFPYKDPIEDENSVEKTTDEELYQPLRTFTRQPKVRLVLIPSKQKPSVPRDAWFEPTKFKNKTPMHIKIKGCRSKEVSLSRDDCDVFNNFRCSGVSVASGLLNRFRYRLHKIEDCPIYGALIL